ncbi:hypothetical protein C6A87_009305 [Mycobacterium sp. ITM-2016-00317]|uniref:hypothetical protein n=1 Tax=Mycobacterium sp. ITM-2016-00317 TaxID=2099694 RepID=UPI000D4ECC58|nr:hypothetical protein [Mycobacterium sp. ITM-2016-00317]WNG89342.1 hypothetical protein C6A87_009305 [Mycobacterium sp. ITM-2016-00317]
MSDPHTESERDIHNSDCHADTLTGGHSDDQKLVLAAYGTALLTGVGLTELGIDAVLAGQQ